MKFFEASTFLESLVKIGVLSLIAGGVGTAAGLLLTHFEPTRSIVAEKVEESLLAVLESILPPPCSPMSELPMCIEGVCDPPQETVDYLTFVGENTEAPFSLITFQSDTKALNWEMEISQSCPKLLTIESGGKLVIKVTCDGTVEYGREGHHSRDAVKAAKIFWTALARLSPQLKCEQIYEPKIREINQAITHLRREMNSFRQHVDCDPGN